MRRYDLDWIRVLVFGLLIIYHVGMFFVPWGWHIKNNVISEDLRWPMLFVNQWRLASLFLISGMGTRFALSKRSSKQYISERVRRLLIPLIVGMLIIIPPQVYVERLAYSDYAFSYWHFLVNDAYTPVYPEGNLSWHHLWFLPYLLIFSLLLTPVFIHLRNDPQSALLSWQRRQLNKNPLFVLVYVIPLFLIEGLIEPFFPVTHALVGDWFTITFFIVIFFYGFNFISLGASFWTALDKIKQMALIGGLILFTLYLLIIQCEDGILIHFTEAMIKTGNMWCWMLAIFGYGAKYLNRSSPLLTYCNKAVYPFYIFHQTITVLIGYKIYQAGWHIGTKFIVLTIGTFLISWILFEIVDRIPVVRQLFGIK